MTKKSLCIGFCASMVFSTYVLGSGFSLNEYSTTGMGRAFAGKGIIGDDYSSIVSNPAGMIFNKSGLQIGGNLINVKANIKNDMGDKTNLNAVKFVPNFFGQYNINDKINIGTAFYAPYGMEAKYDDKWFGRDAALMSKIAAYNFVFASSYKLTENWSVGVGLEFSKMSANLSNDISLTPVNDHFLHSDIKGDSKITPSYTIGVVYNKNENTKLGLSFKSKSKYNLDGKHKISLNSPLPMIPGSVAGQVIADAGVNANITLPESVLLSGYHKISKFGLSGSINWTNWSRFKYLDIYSKAKILGVPVGKQSTYENWKNTLMASVGVDYDVNDKWILRTGIAFDESPIKSDDYRTARIPDNDRWIASIGSSYKFNSGKVDIGYSHVFVKDGVVKYATRHPVDKLLNAKYDLSVNVIGATLQYYF